MHEADRGVRRITDPAPDRAANRAINASLTAARVSLSPSWIRMQKVHLDSESTLDPITVQVLVTLNSVQGRDHARLHLGSSSFNGQTHA